MKTLEDLGFRVSDLGGGREFDSGRSTIISRLYLQPKSLIPSPRPQILNPKPYVGFQHR